MMCSCILGLRYLVLNLVVYAVIELWSTVYIHYVVPVECLVWWLANHWSAIILLFCAPVAEDAAKRSSGFYGAQPPMKKPYTVQSVSSSQGATPTKVHPIESLTPYQNRLVSCCVAVSCCVGTTAVFPLVCNLRGGSPRTFFLPPRTFLWKKKWGKNECLAYFDGVSRKNSE